MARGKSVELATRSFQNQTLATEFFREILRKYKPGDRVSDEDQLHLSALLERHPEYKQKIGAGVDHFEVMKTEQGTNCFRVVRVDGTGTDFSVKSCITGRAPTQKQEVSRALREEVKFDLFDARDKFFKENRGADGKVACGKTSERISREDAHMDHMPPMTFEVLVTTFLGARGLSVDDVSVTSSVDEQTVPKILDRALAEAFKRFHNAMATLEIVKKQVNLSQASRHRIRSGRISLEEAD
jgi:hypothetical protein